MARTGKGRGTACNGSHRTGKQWNGRNGPAGRGEQWSGAAGNGTATTKQGVTEMGHYQWRQGGPKPAVEADVFGAFVEELAEGAEPGAVPPHLIVEKARPRSHPVHDLFDWNDKHAAHAHRLDQARHFVNRLRIVRVELKSNPTISERAFYSVRTPDDHRGYVGRNRIVNDRDLRVQVIEHAKSELESFINKYAAVLTLGRALPHLNDAIESMRDEIDQLATDATRRRTRPAGAPTNDEHAPAE
jgi:hypothetical protein